MKKFYILILAIISLQAISQKDYSRYYNSWRLGLNLGGAWQTADYKSRWGAAGGLTLEKGFHENSTNVFSFAIRGRYLGANTYGMDFNRNYDVKTNDAYNGKYDPAVNFVDSVSAGKSYVYDNYKMTLGEGSLELQLTFNRLRERKHVLLNLWGGVGVTSYRTKSDLLDASGNMYDFSMVDSSGNNSKTLNSYNTLIDKKYESFAYGSKGGKLVTFSPSAGIGLGYQFSPGFSMLWEYKVTFPQGTNADLLDGRFGANKDAIGGSNDYYHYTGINFLFTLRGKKKTPSSNQTVYTNTVVPTNTVAVPTTSLAPTNTVIATIPPAEPKPIITYITPPVNGHIVNNQQYKITAQILNIKGANQIQFKFNGVAYSNFSYNTQNHILEFNANLNVGNNSIQIVASNTAGSDNKTTSVVYELPKPAGTPPLVNIVMPSVCPANLNVKSYNFKAIATNVSQKSNVTVKVNNIVTTYFNFNTTTGQIDLPLILNEGANNIEVLVSNNFGNDSKNCIITYIAPKQVGASPVVTYINPAQPGYFSTTQSYVVKAQVLNVSGQNGISVYYNGVSIPFVYNATTKQVTFTANLNNGSNSISITAGNPSGEDTKATDVVYSEHKITSPPPIVSLVYPALEMNATDNLAYNFKLSVLNVTSKNDISLTFNGMSNPNFVYNATTKQLDFATNLVVGDNIVVVKGTNAFGTDSKTVNVNYKPRVADVKRPPVISITSPAISPTSSSVSNFVFKANVTNISSKAQLVVKLNGNIVPSYVFSMPNIICASTLINGNNIFEITATNNDGTDSKNVIVSYQPKVVSIPPVVNLINPAQQMNATDNLLYNFELSVLNVNSKADVELLFNGVAQSNFTYDAVTKKVFFQTNLVVGDNTVSVKGTNQYGSDSKLVHVNYAPAAQIKLPPVVTIMSPLTSPANSTNTNYNFKASVTNIANTSGLVVKYNGVPVTNYTYDGFNLNYSAILVQGNNTLKVIATNNDGTDSKSGVVIYRQAVVATPPVVNLINPAQEMNATDNLLYNFELSVLNVNSKTDVELLFNGVAQSNFTYDAVTKKVFFQTNLVMGDNTVSVKGTNQYGSDSKLVHVNYTPHADIKLPPVITFVNPVNMVGNSQSTNYIYSATIANMINSNNFNVKFNGAVVTNYTFDGLTLNYPATLNIGANSLEITATNNDGSDLKTATVNYKPKVVSRPPMVNIVQPVGSPTVNAVSYNFQFKAFNVTQNQIEVSLNGNIINTFNFVNPQGNLIANLNQGQNVLSVKATNADGTVTKTENVIYVVVTNTVSVPTPTAPSTPTTASTPTTSPDDATRKITICHIPPGNNQNPQTITIPLAAWAAHQAHGDVIGTCSVSPTAPSTSTTVSTPTTNPADTTRKITICHIPPGNNQNPQTISVPVSAWPAHQAHGDIMGACPAQKTSPVKVNPKAKPGVTSPTENKPSEPNQDTLNQSINAPRRPR